MSKKRITVAKNPSGKGYVVNKGGVKQGNGFATKAKAKAAAKKKRTTKKKKKK